MATAQTPVRVRMATEEDRATALGFISPTTPRGRASQTLVRAGQALLWVAVEQAERAASADAAPAEGAARERLVGLLLAVAQIDPESEEPVGYIQELLVHPAYRRRGVAGQLLDSAEDYFLREQGFALVYLATTPDNEAALRLYRNRGYSLYQVRLSKRRVEPPSL